MSADTIPDDHARQLARDGDAKSVHIDALMVSGRQATIMRNVLNQPQLVDDVAAMHPTGSRVGLWIDPESELGLSLRWLPAGVRATNVRHQCGSTVVIVE